MKYYEPSRIDGLTVVERGGPIRNKKKLKRFIKGEFSTNYAHMPVEWLIDKFSTPSGYPVSGDHLRRRFKK